MLESKHPKKKFEIGYEECAREVELFLSNLIDPQRPGLDGELQRRLKDHLSKRLEDFKNIEPLVESSVPELLVNDESSKDASVSPSPSTTTSNKDLPLCVKAEENYSSDLSPLSKMLNYYSDITETKKRTNENPTFNGIHASKRSKQCCYPTNEENCLTYTRQSQLDTSFRSSDSSLRLLRSDKNHENNQIIDRAEVQTFTECVTADTEISELSTLRHNNCIQSDVSNLRKKPFLPSSSHVVRNDLIDCYEDRSYLEKDGANMYGQSPNVRKQKLIEQIPLVPRQLANGDWALVLPASLVPTEKDDSYPLSAFRLVVPANSSSDVDSEQVKQRFHATSSPLSSTVSDMSMEEYCSRSESDPAERMDRNSPDSTQIVWRPW